MGEGGVRSAASGPVDVSLELPGGTFRAQIAVPEGPLRLAELVPIARELCDRVVEFVQAGHGGPGCGRSMVALSPPEAFCLLEELNCLPPLRRDRTFAAFRLAAERLRHAAALSLTEAAGPENAPVRDGAPPEPNRWYAELELDCPFVAEGPCGQGVHRPLSCRCRPALSAPGRRAAAPVDFAQALCRLAAEVSGIEPRAIPLPLAPLWASAQTGLGRRTWPARALLGRLADILADECRRAAAARARLADAA